MQAKDVFQLSGASLAYMGDAAWEAAVRERLLDQGLTRPKDLHQAALSYVSAKAQSRIVRWLQDCGELSEEENAIFKRGRNASPHTKAAHASTADYRQATGFEALMGYLYLVDRAGRFMELAEKCMEYVEENDHAS